MDCLLVLLALVLRLGMASDLSTRILVAQKFKHVGHITITYQVKYNQPVPVKCFLSTIKPR